MKSLLSNLLRDERGQGLAEYAILLSLVIFATVGLAAGAHSSIATIVRVTNTNLAAAKAAASTSVAAPVPTAYLGY